MLTLPRGDDVAPHIVTAVANSSKCRRPPGSAQGKRKLSTDGQMDSVGRLRSVSPRRGPRLVRCSALLDATQHASEGWVFGFVLVAAVVLGPLTACSSQGAPPLVGATADAPGAGVQQPSVVVAFDAANGAERWRVRAPVVFARLLTATGSRLVLAGDTDTRDCHITATVVALDPSTGAFIDAETNDAGPPPYLGLQSKLTATYNDRIYTLEDGHLQANDGRTGAELWLVSVSAEWPDENEPLSLLAAEGSVYLTFFGSYKKACID